MGFAQKVLVNILIVICLIVALYFYFSHEEKFIVWNDSGAPIEVGKLFIPTAPARNARLNRRTLMSYYKTIKEPIETIQYSYFDFHLFQGYTAVLPGIQFIVKQNGRTYPLGCPSKYKEKPLTLAIITPNKTRDALVANCFSLDVNSFLNYFPVDSVHLNNDAHKILDRYSDLQNRIIVYAAIKTKTIGPSKVKKKKNWLGLS
jgi:hypothetical protein